MRTPVPPVPGGPTARRTLVASSIGAFVEWYDYFIYASTAPVIAALYFPQVTPTAALLGAFAIFAVTFVARPFGGLFFGTRGDRHGRRTTLSVTVLLMGAATVLSGLIPTYAAIGIWAPALLFVVRVVQGFAAGGEAPNALSFVLESAPSDRRGRWTGIVVSVTYLPIAVAALTVLAFQAALGHDAYVAWGWRIPFVIAGLLGAVGWVIRRALRDPAAYTAAVAREGRPEAPLRSLGTGQLRSLVIVFCLGALIGVGGYLLSSYLYTFMTVVVRIPVVPALLTNAIAGVVLAVLIPVSAAVSDRVGRRPMMAAGAGWLALLAVPAFLLTGLGTVAGATAGQLLLAVGAALFFGGAFPTMAEAFPTRLRVTGIGVGYNVSVAVFGGTTALVGTALTAAFDSALAPAFYLVLIAVLTLVTIAIAPETRHRDLWAEAGTPAPVPSGPVDPHRGGHEHSLG